MNMNDGQEENTNNIKKFSSKKLMNYFILAFIFIITSYLSLVFVYHTFGNKTSFVTFKFISYEVIIKLLLLLIIFYLLDGLRLFYILKTLKVKISFRYILKLVFVNIFVSNVTPFATGGGFAQVYFLSKKGISIGNATAATTIRTILPIIFFFITTPIILLTDKSLRKIIPNNGGMSYVFIIICVYTIIAYIFYKIIVNTKVSKKILYNIFCFLYKIKLISDIKNKKLRKTFFKEIDSFVESLKKYFNGNSLDIFMSIIFTLLYLLSLFYFSVILISGFNQNVSTIKIMSLQDIVIFITYFAPTPGSTGIAEWANSLIFSDFIKKEYLVSLTFAWRFFTMYLGMFIGMIIFYFELIKNKKHI